jgi:hypothetical protein
MSYVNVGNGQQLRNDAAVRFRSLQERRFRETGKRDLYCLEGLRSLDRQWTLWYARQAYLRYLAGGPYAPHANLAAYPGTSRHGSGIAVDFNYPSGVASSELSTWLRANAPKDGFVATGMGFGSIEPWHYDFIGVPTHPVLRPGFIEPAELNITRTIKENDMIVLHHVGKSGKFKGWQGTVSDVLIRHTKGTTPTDRAIAKNLREKLEYVKVSSDTEFYGFLAAMGWSRSQVPLNGEEFNRIKENRELIRALADKTK